MPVLPRAKKPAQPVAPTPPAPTPPPAAAPRPNRRVVFPRLTIEEYSTTSPNGPLTPDLIVKALGWETESEFLARKLRENPGTTAEQWMANPRKKDTFGDDFHCKNVAGEKVRCNNNAHNRPFDMVWCEHLIQTVLTGTWAGPHTIPGETVNGETVRISRYGEVISAQHQMTAVKLADERLHKYRADYGMDAANEKYPAWSKHNNCFIETIVIKGMSDHPSVLMSVDYVKPRTAADVFYTSEVFKEASPQERKLLCDGLANATDLLWVRTDAKGYRTHPEVVGFLERHSRLLRCVLRLFALNNPITAGDRKISKCHLTPGRCAALMYLMGASGTEPEDSDAYRNMTPPTEKSLDWSMWEQAEEFWRRLAAGSDFAIVRDVLSKLMDSDAGSEVNQGLGGRWPEKLAILAKAWLRWTGHRGTGAVFDEDDKTGDGIFALAYSDVDDKGKKLPVGQIKLVNVADFYGIDCPDRIAPTGQVATPPEEPMAELTRDEIAQACEAAQVRRATEGRRR